MAVERCPAKSRSGRSQSGNIYQGLNNMEAQNPDLCEGTLKLVFTCLLDLYIVSDEIGHEWTRKNQH